MKTVGTVFFLFFIASVWGETNFFDDHARGWHWYEADDEAQTKTEKEDPTKPLSATERLKKFQEELEEAKAEAVLSPTPHNVLKYQEKQYDMLNKAGKFSDVWANNTYRHPDIDYTQKSPMSQNARHLYLQDQQKQTEQTIRSLSKDYGLFYFFKRDCTYCDEFNETVQRFSEKYEWEVLAISEKGERHPLFKRCVKDNGLAETWGVVTYPSLYAVNPKTGHVIPIAHGMISIQDMEERIMSLTKGEEK